MTSGGNGTLEDQLVSILDDKKKSPEQEKKELEELRLQYTENKKKFEKLFKIFKDAHDIGDEILDEDVRKKFDENIDLIVEKVDKFRELEFIDERTSSMKVIVRQNDLLWEIKELVEEVVEVIDADISPGAMPDIKESNDKVSKKTTMEKSRTKTKAQQEDELFSFFEKSKEFGREGDDKVNEDNENPGLVEGEITWHKAKTEAEEYGKNNKAVFGRMMIIKREISQRDKKIDQFKKTEESEERAEAIRDAKEFKLKSAQELYKFVQEQKAIVKQRKEQQNTKKVERAKEINERYDAIVIDAQKNHSGIKQIKDKVSNTQEAIKNKKKEIGEVEGKKEKRKKIKEVTDLKEKLANELAEMVAEKVEHFKRKKEERKQQRKDKQGDKNKVNADKQGRDVKQFEVNEKEIGDEIDNLFISDEIEEYIGTGKSKRTQERHDRIELYKKEIVESIVEIENAAGRTINLKQFALDYIADQKDRKARRVHEILIGNIAEQEKSVQNLRQERNEVHRESDVIAIEDMSGEMYNFEGQVTKTGLAKKSDNGSWEWTGGNQKAIFLGDVLGDRGLGGIEIMKSVDSLSQQAERESGEIEVLYGNHDRFFVSFLTEHFKDEIIEYFKSIYKQNIGIFELTQFSDSDSQLHKYKDYSWLEFKDATRHNRTKKDLIAELYKQMSQIRENMRNTTEGVELIESLCKMKIVTIKDDVLYCHTDPTPEMIQDLLSEGDIYKRVEEINQLFEDNLRGALYEDEPYTENFEAVQRIYTATGNRENFIYASKSDDNTSEIINNLRNNGINTIIHGHSRGTKAVEKDGFIVLSPHSRFTNRDNVKSGCAVVHQDGTIISNDDTVHENIIENKKQDLITKAEGLANSNNEIYRTLMSQLLHIDDDGKWIADDKRRHDIIILSVNENLSKAVVKIGGVEKTMDLLGSDDNLIPTLQREYKFVEDEAVDFEEMLKTRKAADITFKQMEAKKIDTGKLNAETLEKGDEKFKQVTRQVWRELVVHGKFFKNRETGESGWQNKTDLDGQMALKLLSEAGIKKQNVTYVPQGEYRVDKINIDTGNQDGLVILDDGAVVIDHHGEESGNDNSSTKITYEILTRLGVLEDRPEYKRAVDFVTGVDNFDYLDADNYFKNYFKNSWKTLQGLQYMLNANQVLNFFKDEDNLSSTEPLSPEKMKKFGFTFRAKGHDKSQMESHQYNVSKAHTELERLKEEGFILKSKEYGEICVDVNQTLNNDAVRAFGCSTYIKWNKKDDSVFISNLVGKPLRDKFEQGKNIRKTMWIKPRDDGKKMTMQLKDVLEKMTDGKLKTTEELQEVLDTNGERTDRVELTEKEQKYLTVHIERAKEDIAFVQSMDLEKFNIKGRKAINKKRDLIKIVWKELAEDIEKGTRFTSGEAEDIVLLIQDKL